MLATLASMFGGQIIDGLIGKGAEVFEAYLKKQISVEELRTKLMQILLETCGEIEKAHADALTKTYESFQQTLRGSPEMVRMFTVVIYSQLAVLVWHQVGIPALVMAVRWLWIPGWSYPSSGTTAEWAYLLIGGLCGAAPMLLRAGPGAGDIAGSLKRMIAK